MDLEGRFGALKILTITHFKLPHGEYQKKSIDELKQLLCEKKDERELARIRLDLLGEYYDDWRHALEQKRKIKVDDTFYRSYDWLLKFAEESK